MAKEIPEKTIELALMLESLKERFPEVYRHIMGLIRSMLA